MSELSAWKAVAEAVSVIGKDEISDEDIQEYVRKNYLKPLGKNTIRRHLDSLCVNYQYRATSYPGKCKDEKYDILYRIKKGVVTAYNSEVHGIWKNGQLVNGRKVPELAMNINPSQTSKLTHQEKMALFISGMIEQHGIGFEIATEEIQDALFNAFDVKRGSLLPSDYCYNRWNKGLPEHMPAFLEYLDRGNYRVLGANYPYNGEIFTRPKNEIQDRSVGYCIDGQKHIGRLAIYPDDLSDTSPEYLEGKKKTVLINTYERNTAARQKCIDHYGAICFICGFNFSKAYGEECEGLIHVHHLKKVSEADTEYVVNPINDLRPVCPNCHMVLHSRKEGFEIDDVKNILKFAFENLLK
jgi:5-methylcytosine-specific restriction protein A